MTKHNDKESHSPRAGKPEGGSRKEKAESTLAGTDKGIGKKTPGDDYWNRIAEDVASGYKTKHDESSVLNEDEAPEDNEKAG